MPFDSPSALLDWLRDNQILSPAQIADLTAPGNKPFSKPEQLLQELENRGWLTPYQLRRLRRDEGQRLLLGPYRIMDRLGMGGMGEVFRARHVVMDRVVALKLVSREYLDSPKAIERFRQEARAAAQLMHPNIVIAHDANEVDGKWYFAMEYVVGTDLAKVIGKRGPLPYAEACEYIRQAALGLQHAHEKGVVHRDIKPSNRLLTKAGGAPQLKILDFGLARFGSENLVAQQRVRERILSTVESIRLTQVGAIMGTADYISPEQAEDATTTDSRSDIFSLGCTLFFLLTREHPFPGQDTLEKIRKRKYGDPIPVRNIREDVPPDLERVLLKMTARLPKNRYQTAAEVAAALEPFAREASKSPKLVGEARLRPSPARTADVGPGRGTNGAQWIGRDARLARRLARTKQRASLALWLHDRWEKIVLLGLACLVLLFLAMALSSWLHVP
jgi:serine/threonine-protein kinase